MYCTYCGKTLTDKSKYCRHCGKAQSAESEISSGIDDLKSKAPGVTNAAAVPDSGAGTIKCAHCGAAMPINSNHCYECGKKHRPLGKSLMPVIMLIVGVLIALVIGLVGPDMFESYTVNNYRKKVTPLYHSFQTIRNEMNLGWEIKDTSESNLLEKIEKAKKGISMLDGLRMRVNEVDGTNLKSKKIQEEFLSSIDAEKQCLQQSIPYFNSLRFHRDIVIAFQTPISVNTKYVLRGRHWEEHNQWSTVASEEEVDAAAKVLSQASFNRGLVCDRKENKMSVLRELLK